MKKLIFSFLVFAGILFAQFPTDIVSESNIKTVQKNNTVYFDIALKIKEGWHINSNKPNEDFLYPTQLKITAPQEIEIIRIQYPKAEDVKFSFSDVPVSVYEGLAVFKAEVKAEPSIQGKIVFAFLLEYQACDNSVCLPPADLSFKTEVEIIKSEPVLIDTAAKADIEEQPSDTVLSSEIIKSENSVIEKKDYSGTGLEDKPFLIMILITFLGGLALNLTPCVYPLIPITIGYFGGQSEGRTSRLFIMGLFYVLGMALTYSVIGVVTAMSGAVLGSLLQNPVVIIIIALIFIALALSMFGLYEFSLPNSLMAKAGGAKGGMAGAFFMGLTMGIVAAPCIGPFVFGLITFVAAEGEVLTGFALFFSLAVGLGLPYLILALFSGKIKNLPRAGIWMNAVKKIFGYVLIGMSVYFLAPLFPKNISGYLLPGYLILAGILLLLFNKSNLKGFNIANKIIAYIFIIAGVYFILPEKQLKPEWISYSDDIYQKAYDNKDKIILDFYADWCIPCKEFDKFTFSDESVVSEMKEFINIKIDMTKSSSPEVERLRKKFNVIGVPTIIIINSKGEEAERLTGFTNAEQFLGIINKVQ